MPSSVIAERILSAEYEDAVDQVREVIGNEATSGIPDDFMKEVVWNEGFSVEKSIEILRGSCLTVIVRSSSA